MTTEDEMQTLAEELKPQLLALEDRFDAARTDPEREAIAKEGTELVARALIRQMLAKIITPEAIAQFASGGGVAFVRDPANPTAPPAMVHSEFVVPKS
jgi:hypothetical protein